MKVWRIIFGSKFSDIYLIKGDLSSVLLLFSYGLVFFVLVLFMYIYIYIYIYIYTIYIYYMYNIYIYTWVIVSSRWLPCGRFFNIHFIADSPPHIFAKPLFLLHCFFFFLFFFVTHNNWYGKPRSGCRCLFFVKTY